MPFKIREVGRTRYVAASQCQRKESMTFEKIEGGKPDPKVNIINVEQFAAMYKGVAAERDKYRTALEQIEDAYGLLFDNGDIQLTKLMSIVRNALRDSSERKE